MKAIPLVLRLQNEGNAIERLYKKGMLTDDMHFLLKQLKSFVEQEFEEVRAEAEEYLEGWSQVIWPQAMQFYQMVKKHADGEGGDDGGDGEEDVDAEEVMDQQPTTSRKKTDKAAKKDPLADKLKNKTPEEIAEMHAAQLLKEEEAANSKKQKGGSAVKAKAVAGGKERRVTPVTLD